MMEIAQLMFEPEYSDVKLRSDMSGIPNLWIKVKKWIANKDKHKCPKDPPSKYLDL